MCGLFPLRMLLSFFNLADGADAVDFQHPSRVQSVYVHLHIKVPQDMLGLY